MFSKQALSLLLSAALCSAGCTRESLRAASDAFFKSAFAKSATPAFEISSNVKITQNNQLLSNLAASAYANITGFAKGYRLDAIDTDLCQIATFALPNEGTGVAVMSIRIKVSGRDGAVTEVEILNALKDSHALFNITNFPEKTPAVWLAPQGATQISRAELVKIVDTYPQGLQTGKDEGVLAGVDCPRLENGVQTTGHCNIGMNNFIWPVTDRRWVADTKTGVTMGSFFFHYRNGTGILNQRGIRSNSSKTGLWLHEYFKVQDGKLISVSAAMQTLDAEYKDIWALASNLTV
jgi:hypothetical protein